REIGFPTANVENIVELTPRHAVYAAVAQLDDGTLRLAAVNIGPQPTFAQQTPRVEAHLLDFEGSLTNRRLGLHLLRAIRPQRKFEDAAALAKQLRADVARVREQATALDRVRESLPPSL
ncbi:MAG: bifunctional riboflavin kinase/FAD synthetase, partial [Planctomycetota bacterium]